MRNTVGIPRRWAEDRLLKEMLGEPIAVTHSEAAIVVEHLTQRGRAFLGVGEPDAVAELLARQDPSGFAHGMVPQGTWEQLPPDLSARFELPEREDWEWMDIHHVPPAPGSDRVRELDPVVDRAEIDRVRTAAIPNSFLTVERPGSRWFGWADPQGVIRGIGGAMGWDGTSWPTGAHYGSIGTEPGWQGRGIGTALTAGMVAIAFREGAATASLGVHSHNTRALKVYRRLGFRTNYRIHSRWRAS